MTATAAPRTLAARSGDGGQLLAPIAWRNLWRNRRRTYLTAGAIAFAVALLSFALSMQLGSYATMIDNATSLLSSHLQIQRASFRDDPRIETTIKGSTALRERVERMAGVRAASERIQAFVLASAGERTFATELLGVDPARERAVSSLSLHVVEGRYLTVATSASAARADAVEVFAGATLAKNLGVAVGDELTLLGTDASGGVAVLSGTLIGTFATGVPELDRAVLEVPLDAVRAAFSFGDEAHAIVIRSESTESIDALASQLRALDLGNAVVLDWRALMPDLVQAITLDRTSGRILFGMLAAIVAIGVVSTFAMLVFERTHEFGVLLAIGMRPWRIIGMLELEAGLLALLGIAVGIAIAVPLVIWVSHVGIGMGDGGAMLKRFHMADRIYPALSRRSLFEPTAILAVATLAAAFLPSLRVRGLTPVGALRGH